MEEVQRLHRLSKEMRPVAESHCRLPRAWVERRQLGGTEGGLALQGTTTSMATSNTSRPEPPPHPHLPPPEKNTGSWNSCVSITRLPPKIPLELSIIFEIQEPEKVERRHSWFNTEILHVYLRISVTLYTDISIRKFKSLMPRHRSSGWDSQETSLSYRI